MSSPDQMKRFQDRGLDVVTNSPEEFAAYLKERSEEVGQGDTRAEHESGVSGDE